MLTRTHRLARLLLAEANPGTYPPVGPSDADWELIPAEHQYTYMQRAERIAEQLPEGDYEFVRDRIAERFNPPDDDAAETHICCEAIDAAATFIEAQPCKCTPEMVEDHSPCERCRVLGRNGDVALAQ